jgi:signal transduction histidine kinase/PAS domain-containing protein
MEKEGEDSLRAMLPLKGGIRRKLFLGYAVQLAIVLGAVFSIVMALNLVREHRNFRSVQGAIGKAIVAKGTQQAFTTKMLLGGLADGSSAPMFREILQAVLAGDPEIVYAVYMDSARRPVAVARSGDTLPQEAALAPSALPAPLEDEMSLWASKLTGIRHRSVGEEGGEVIEFAAPVERKGVLRGTVRIGISTASMYADLHDARLSWRKMKEMTVLLFALLGFFTFLMAMWSSAMLSRRITGPIRALTGSAIRIANGEYGAKVESGGEDEIAVLAEAFESMRGTINRYTGNLEMLVDEKVRQIREILDNVKQGIFTFNLDLTVNADCSLSACEILGMKELTGRTLAEVLRLGARDDVFFHDWIEVLLKNHKTLRWEKLAKLAPLHEFRLGSRASARQIRLEYQKILDAKGDLAKIMVLIQDVTETKLQEQRIKEDKLRLENKVKTILGITSNPPEVISEFLKDSTVKINTLHMRLERLDEPVGSSEGRGKYPGEPEAGGGYAGWIRAAYKDCHTIKGNAGAFGFESLMELAHDLESQMDAVNRGSVSWSESFPSARRLIHEMREEIKRMHEIHLLLSGNSEEIFVRLPESKVMKIRELAGKAESQALSPELLILVEYCKRIAYRGLFSLTRKYQDLVARVAAKVGKDAELEVSPRDLELDPELLFKVDEALVHLLRNAVVHGLEEVGSPELMKKGSALLEIVYFRSLGGHVFQVKDNGRGIDGSALAERAVAAGILDRKTASAMEEKEKLQLIFCPGLSTSDEPDPLSGRGMGLTIARESLKAFGGSLAVESSPGKGTVFTITLPLHRI